MGRRKAFLHQAKVMNELEMIESAVERAGWRQRWARALHGLWRGLLIGAVLSFLLAGTYHLWPLPLWTLIVAAFLPFPCMLIGLLAGGWRRPPLNEVARWIDGRQHLQERLSTALEVASCPGPGSWRDLVVSDAAVHAKGLDARKLLPFHLPKVTRWALLALVLAGGLGFIPEYRSKAYLKREAERQNIQDVGKRLTELTRRNLQKRQTLLPPTQKAMEAVNEIGQRLSKVSLTRSEALKDLSSVSEKLQDQLKQLGQDPELRRLEQAARAPSNDNSQDVAGLQKQIESLQKQLGTPVGNPEALNDLKQRLQKLQAAAEAFANGHSPSAAEKQKLSDSLSALSRQMQAMGLQVPQLDAAIQALAANQTDLFLKDLQSSEMDLQKLRDLAKSLQQLQQQMEKIGKDLAEQLKNGQPEAAQATLQKMISELQSAHLPPQQLQKLMREVAKAVKPAGHYGKVAKFLSQAVQQMRASNCSSAAQSLADASKELQKLMRQMGDAQSLLAELQALDKASWCIGSGQCLGLGTCNKPGFHPGGRPGSGVGTWAEDPAAGWNGQFSDHWDNSGIYRPDMAPRGVTDRGPAKLSDALKPTRVRGQFSPGGPMPSITLKGISIKGQSKIDYQAAATAAQSDAESALSQGKVPRAYQGAVKDYFDNLNK